MTRDPQQTAPSPARPTPETGACPVRTYTEWDPLEEIVVGIVEDALVPPWDDIMPAVVHDKRTWDYFKLWGGTRWPPEQLKKAEADIEAFVHILEAEGVKVRRPERFAWEKPIATPDWSLPSSLYALMPRDVLLIVGELVVEAPMGWRSRYFEHLAYKRLCKEYWAGGAQWISAPRPQLSDESYDQDFVPMEEGEPQRFIPTEFEPLFDAADFIKCGRDLFAIRSSCTNEMGIEWVRRTLGPDYAVHEIEHYDTHPMHIDATFYPLAPGKLLINPERIRQVPPMFEAAGWEILTCPPPQMPESHPMYNCSRWIMMNVLLLDERRIVVSKGEHDFVRQLKKWGFEPIECPFWDFATIGGGFHCATVDVRRRGGLQSYF